MRGFIYYANYITESMRDEELEAELTREREREARWDAEAAEDERLEAGLREALAYAEEVGDWDMYSDVFKDLYGFRPRW